MTSTIEYLALGTVAIVLLISAVQAVQLSGLSEKVAEQNAVLSPLGSGSTTITAANQANQASAPTQAAPSNQMVGGC